jgi:release factor glutamine methyltransferase
MNLREAITRARANLAAVEALRENAARDAEMLLLDTLGLTRTELLGNPARPLTSSELAQYLEAVARRERCEPIQYITGRAEFYGMPLRVTPAVLIPRPETELLVETVLERLPPDLPATIIDVGTGSGAIAVALAAHLPLASIAAVDTSEAALEVARRNAHTHGVEARIRFVLSDLLDGLSEGGWRQHFDAVVSNPPYVPTGDAAQLHPQVRDYEPAAALYAGADGLAIYRRLIPEAHVALKPGGLLALEIGHEQRDALTALLEGWREITFLNDLQGIPRVVLARR